MAGLAPFNVLAGNPYQGAIGQTAKVQAPNVGTATQVQAPAPTSAYAQAIQAQLQPQFDENQNQLQARLQSMGILNSGAGAKAFQYLQGMNNQALTGATAPYIQQAFGQQFAANQQNAGAQNALQQLGLTQAYGANSQNASAHNAYLQQLQNQAFGGASQAAQSHDQYANLLQNQAFQGSQAAIDRNMQAQQFNDQLLAQIYGQNLNADLQTQLAQMGYGNQAYQNAIAQIGGLRNVGLGGTSYAVGQGMNNQLNAYMGSQQQYAPYAQQIGQAAGYGSGTPQSAFGYNYPTGIPLPSASPPPPQDFQPLPAGYYGDF